MAEAMKKEARSRKMIYEHDDADGVSSGGSVAEPSNAGGESRKSDTADGAGAGAGAPTTLMLAPQDFKGKNISEQLIMDVAIKPPSAAAVLNAGRLAAGRRRLMAAKATQAMVKNAHGRSKIDSSTNIDNKAAAYHGKDAKPGGNSAQFMSMHAAVTGGGGARTTRKKKNVKVEAVEAARPVLSAIAKRTTVSKDTYKALLRTVVQRICENTTLLHNPAAIQTLIESELQKRRPSTSN